MGKSLPKYDAMVMYGKDEDDKAFGWHVIQRMEEAGLKVGPLLFFFLGHTDGLTNAPAYQYLGVCSRARFDCRNVEKCGLQQHHRGSVQESRCHLHA